MDRDVLTRRRVLTGVGAASVAAFVGLGAGTDDAVDYTFASTALDCEGFDLNAEWRETYTTDSETILLENRTASGSEDSGREDSSDPPIIALDDVLPEDSGVVSVRLGLDADGDDVTVEPELSLVLEETAENGLTDPEEEAGDTSQNEGELQEYIDVAVWEDTGLMDIDVFGADNMERDFGERLLTNDDGEDAEGTLAEVAKILDGVSLGTLNDDGDTVTVSFGWEFDSENDPINVTQSDSVKFTFDIHAECAQ